MRFKKPTEALNIGGFPGKHGKKSKSAKPFSRPHACSEAPWDGLQDCLEDAASKGRSNVKVEKVMFAGRGGRCPDSFELS